MSRLQYGGDIDVECISGIVDMTVDRDGEWMIFHPTPIEAIGLAQMLLKAANAEVPS